MSTTNALNVLLKNREGTPLIPFVAPDDTISPDSNKPVQSQAVYEALQNIGRRYLGEVFAYPSAVPPEGAYLLNGQTITGCNELYPRFWEWVTTANVRTIDNATFEAELASFGVCDGFVIDSAAGSVRLPKWNGYRPVDNIQTVPVVGNGMSLGLTDGTNYAGLYTGADYGMLGSQPRYFGAAVGSNGTDDWSDWLSNATGVTTDSEKSGIVADISGFKDDGFHWCIQVYNAATALSEQESAQLASQMQMKAQTDLANVAANIDFIIEHDEAADGSWWYDRYRSGKVAQGGVCPYHTENYNNVITLPVEMRDTNYVITYGEMMNKSNNWYEGVGEKVFFDTISVTGFELFQWGNRQVRWRVEGYAATE